MLNECGKQLDMAYKGQDQYMEQDFTDYILSLKPYSLFLGVHLQPYYFILIIEFASTVLKLCCTGI